MFNSKSFLIFLIFFLSSPLVWGQTQLELTGLTMGPIKYKVVIAHYPDSVKIEKLADVVGATLGRVNGLMSTYIPESDVSRFNHAQSTDFQSVDLETATVVARALEISEQTEGAFDISVAPAVNLWKFGPDKTKFEVPSEQAISEVAKLVGYDKLTVRLDPPAIKKSIEGLQIDLSAIAKGYAVDQVAKSLDELGCQKFMVEVGGEVFTRGERTMGGKWRIAIETPSATLNPKAVTQEFGKVAEISDRALATSGDYRNFQELDGKRFSHTIAPKTSRPVEHHLASACIIAADCMTADAVATAVMVTGVEGGKKICKRLGVEYILVERNADFGNVLKEHKSLGFPLLNENQVQSIWPVFLVATVVFGLVILGMAVGSIFANKPITGSCGGLASMANEDGDEVCGICSKPTTDCIEKAGDITATT